MDWFKHDVTAQMDIKIKKLVRNYGYEGYGVYWNVIELLYSKGGKIEVNELVDELDLTDNSEYVDVLERFGLIEVDHSNMTVSCKRVMDAILESEGKRKHFSEMGKASAESRSNKGSANVERTLSTGSTNVERKLNVGSTERKKEREIDITYSELLSTNVSNNSPYVGSELSFDSVQAGTPDPIFITILTNGNTEFPIRESSISLWEDTFKAVNVREELKKMKSWSVANPKLRKTERGMMRFVHNWLSGEQDKASRQSYRSQPEVIKGTNIKMPVTADGSDRDKYRQDPNEVLRKYGLLPEGGKK